MTQKRKRHKQLKMDTGRNKVADKLFGEIFADRLNFVLGVTDTDAACLAKLAGISESAISRYCSGQCMPNLYNFELICRALKVDPAFLMGSARILKFRNEVSDNEQ